MTRPERVLFVHAHPDDETLATGATIATLVERGAEVTVVTCTRGELGEIIPEELRATLTSPTELGAYRERELAQALAALGVTDHRILGSASARWTGRPPRKYLDSGMRWSGSGAQALTELDPQCLSEAELGEVAADIAAVLIEVEPDVVISYGQDGGYGHPDHIRAHEATRTAAEVIGVPFYVIDSALARHSSLTVDPTPVLDRKAAALAAHRTQITIDGDDYSLSSGDPRPIATPEHFSRLRVPGTGFADHGVPSRIAACVLATVLGAFVGATLTVAHQASVQIGTVTLPWGIIAAVVVTAALLVGLRIVFETRIVVACAALGLLVVSAYLAVGPAADSVLPSNPVGYLWAFASVFLVAVTLAWPTRPLLKSGSAAQDKIVEIPASKGPDPK